MGESSYAPGDLIPIAGLPEGFETLEVALDFGSGEVVRPQFLAFREQAGAFLFAQPHPSAFTETHTAAVVVTVDGAQRCEYPAAAEVEGLPAADPAVVDQVVDDLVAIARTSTLGVEDPQQILDAEPEELDAQNRMARLLLQELDGEDEPNSFRHLLRGDAAIYEGNGHDPAYMASVLASAEVPEQLATYREEQEMELTIPFDLDFNAALPCDSVLPLQGVSLPAGVEVADSPEELRCWFDYGEIADMFQDGLDEEITGWTRTFFSLVPAAGLLDTVLEKLVQLMRIVLPQNFRGEPTELAPGESAEPCPATRGIEFTAAIPESAATEEGVLFRYDASEPGQLDQVALVVEGGGLTVSSMDLLAQLLDVLARVIPGGKLLDKLAEFAGPKVRRFIRDTLGSGEWLDRLDRLRDRAKRTRDDIGEYARNKWDQLREGLSDEARMLLDEAQAELQDRIDGQVEELRNELAGPLAGTELARTLLEGIAEQVHSLTGLPADVSMVGGEWVLTIVPATYRFDDVDIGHESIDWTGSPLREPIFELDDEGLIVPVDTGTGQVRARTTAFFPDHTGRGCLDVGVACPVVDVADLRTDRFFEDPAELSALATMPEDADYCFTPRGVANVIDESLSWELVRWDSVGEPPVLNEYAVGNEYGWIVDGTYVSPREVNGGGIRFGVRATAAAEGVHEDPDVLRAECPTASQFGLLEVIPDWPAYESTCGCTGEDCVCPCSGTVSGSWSTVDGRSGGGANEYSGVDITLDEEDRFLTVRHNGFELAIADYTGSGNYTGYNTFGADRPDDLFDVRGTLDGFDFDFASTAPACHENAQFQITVTQEGDCISGEWMASLSEDGSCICSGLPDCDPSLYGSGHQSASGAFSGSATVPCEGECEAESEGELCRRGRVMCGAHEAVDRCGETRTLSCGECTAPALCGDGTCCTPPTDEELCGMWSMECGPLMTLDVCGQMREVECPCSGAGECRGGTCCEPGTAEDFCGGSECGSATVVDGCGDLTTFDCGSCSGGVCEGGTCCNFADHLEDDTNCNCAGPCASDETCNGGVCECDPADHPDDDADCGCMGPCGAGAACNGGQCVEVACGDGGDNDSDGGADCADGDCAGAPGCVSLSCTSPGTVEVDVPVSGSTAGHDADDDLTSCSAFGGDAVLLFQPPVASVTYCFGWDTGSRPSSATILDGCDPLSAEIACSDTSSLELVPDGPVRIQVSADPSLDGGTFEALITAGACP